MKITSQPALVHASIGQLKDFLCDCRNIIHLLPQDQVSDWNSEMNWCSFKVQGGIIITLVKDEKDFEENIIRLKSGEKSPFPFKLSIYLESLEDTSKGHIEFDGDVNVFLKMMIERPLTNLFNTMTENLKSYFLDAK
jgi:hypothetical protein